MSTPAERLDDAVRRIRELTRDRAPTGVGHDDADDGDGTVATDDAVGFDPRRLLGALAHHGARVVVIGQVAGILHGSAELTGDLDLLWDGDPRQRDALAAAYAEVGAEIFDGDGERAGPDAFALPKVLFRSRQACGDLCTPALPWGTVPIASILRHHCTTTTAEGVLIRYVARPDLVAMRRAVGRPKDIRRADELVGVSPE